MAKTKTSWKEGESGNPDGKALTLSLRRHLKAPAFNEDGNEILEEDASGKKRKVKNLDLVARQLVTKAKKGDISAIQECFNRIDGRVPQHVSSDSTVTHKHDGVSILAELLEGALGAGPERDVEGMGEDGSVLPDQVRSRETRH